jgi:hypothetical protein
MSRQTRHGRHGSHGLRPYVPRLYLLSVMANQAGMPQTPAEFRISVVEDLAGTDTASKPSHDRIIKVQIVRSGVAVPPSGPLNIFSREPNPALRNVTQEGEALSDARSAVQYGGEESLVFDLVVEPLLFGVLPLGSLETGMAVVITAVVGSLILSGFFKYVPM